MKIVELTRETWPELETLSTLDMFLAAGFTFVDRRGTRRALVRKELR